jgi:hypothetical protein
MPKDPHNHNQVVLKRGNGVPNVQDATYFVLDLIASARLCSYNLCHNRAVPLLLYYCTSRVFGKPSGFICNGFQGKEMKQYQQMSNCRIKYTRAMNGPFGFSVRAMRNMYKGRRLGVIVTFGASIS